MRSFRESAPKPCPPMAQAVGIPLLTRQQFYTDNFAKLVPPVGELSRSA